jgi:hypothetical protein
VKALEDKLRKTVPLCLGEVVSETTLFCGLYPKLFGQDTSEWGSEIKVKFDRAKTLTEENAPFCYEV